MIQLDEEASNRQHPHAESKLASLTIFGYLGECEQLDRMANEHQMAPRGFR